MKLILTVRISIDTINSKNIVKNNFAYKVCNTQIQLHTDSERCSGK